MDDERPDEEEAWRDQDPPGSVSSQNQEEAEGGHGKEEAEAGRGKEEGGRGKPPQPEEDDGGASSEGSQSTGHPEHAG